MEAIRRRLIRLFASRGSNNPEELADETIDRVASKSPQLIDKYAGDPSAYFYGVAKYVWLELTLGSHYLNQHRLCLLLRSEIDPGFLSGRKGQEG